MEEVALPDKLEYDKYHGVPATVLEAEVFRRGKQVGEARGKKRELAAILREDDKGKEAKKPCLELQENREDERGWELVSPLPAHPRELVEGETLNQLDIKCCICHELLEDPVKLQCNHSFCSSCIMRHLANKAARDVLDHGVDARQHVSGASCPLCRKRYETHSTSQEKQSAIERIIVSCPNERCRIKMPFHEVVPHLIQCNKTSFRCMLPCPVSGAVCGEVCTGKEGRERHRRQACPYKLASCNYGCGQMVARCHKEAHRKVCPLATVKCKHCGIQGLRKDHMSPCPEELIPCDICGTLVKSKDMESHISSSLALHMVHLQKKVLTLQKESTMYRQALESKEKEGSGAQSYVRWDASVGAAIEEPGLVVESATFDVGGHTLSAGIRASQSEEEGKYDLELAIFYKNYHGSQVPNRIPALSFTAEAFGPANMIFKRQDISKLSGRLVFHNFGGSNWRKISAVKANASRLDIRVTVNLDRVTVANREENYVTFDEAQNPFEPLLDLLTSRGIGAAIPGAFRFVFSSADTEE